MNCFPEENKLIKHVLQTNYRKQKLSKHIMCKTAGKAYF